MVHKGTSSSNSHSTVSGFDLAWFSSLSSEHLCIFGWSSWCYICAVFFGYILFFAFLV